MDTRIGKLEQNKTILARVRVVFAKKEIKLKMIKAKKRLRNNSNISITDDLMPNRADLHIEQGKQRRKVMPTKARALTTKTLSNLQNM